MEKFIPSRIRNNTEMEKTKFNLFEWVKHFKLEKKKLLEIFFNFNIKQSGSRTLQNLKLNYNQLVIDKLSAKQSLNVTDVMYSVLTLSFLTWLVTSKLPNNFVNWSDLPTSCSITAWSYCCNYCLELLFGIIVWNYSNPMYMCYWILCINCII